MNDYPRRATIAEKAILVVITVAAIGAAVRLIYSL